MNTLKIATLSAALVYSSSTFASQKNYAGINLGSAILHTKAKTFVQDAVAPDINSSKKKPKSAFLVDIYAGTNLIDGLSGELELAYSTSHAIKDSSFIVIEETTTVKAKVHSFSGFLNAKYHFNQLHSNIKPFVFIGLGAASNRVYKVRESRMTEPYSYGANTQTNFAWQIGTGVLYKASENLGLTLTYAFRNLGKYKSQKTIIEENNVISQPPVRGKLKTSNIMAGMQFSF